MRAVAIAALLGFGAGGCGGDEWTTIGGAGPATEVEAQVPGLHGDMLTPDQAVNEVQSALSSDDGSKAGSPKVFYLFYADGTDLPKTDVNACKGTPPKFNCTFAPTLAECQRQIQSYLDRWYADFNIIFTFTRPTSGKYYTEVVSSGGGAWCGLDSKVAGVSPFLCKDIQGGVAYTFQGGADAKTTAIIIAQEQAHLLGLEHTKSTSDLMYPTICHDCDGFVNQDLAIDGDRCDRASQNSYKSMKDHLGAWPGGPKPSPFGCMTDDEAPGLKILEPADGAMVGHDFTVKVDARDDCELSRVQVSVAPQALTAESKAAPYQWDLTNISGQQTITVTAVDGKGHTAVAKVTVTAPVDAAGTDPATASAGCTVASGAFSLAGLLPSLAMLLLFPRRRRGPAGRRRHVSGALEGMPAAAPRPEAAEAAPDREDASAVTGPAAQVPLGGQ